MTVRFLEALGMGERRPHAHLVEHLRLDLAPGAELLEDRVGALLGVGADELEGLEPVGEFVEEEVLLGRLLAAGRHGQTVTGLGSAVR